MIEPAVELGPKAKVEMVQNGSLAEDGLAIWLSEPLFGSRLFTSERLSRHGAPSVLRMFLPPCTRPIDSTAAGRWYGAI